MTNIETKNFEQLQNTGTARDRSNSASIDSTNAKEVFSGGGSSQFEADFSKYINKTSEKPLASLPELNTSSGSSKSIYASPASLNEISTVSKESASGTHAIKQEASRESSYTNEHSAGSSSGSSKVGSSNSENKEQSTKQINENAAEKQRENKEAAKREDNQEKQYRASEKDDQNKQAWSKEEAKKEEASKAQEKEKLESDNENYKSDEASEEVSNDNFYNYYYNQINEELEIAETIEQEAAPREESLENANVEIDKAETDFTEVSAAEAEEYEVDLNLQNEEWGEKASDSLEDATGEELAQELEATNLTEQDPENEAEFTANSYDANSTPVASYTETSSDIEDNYLASEKTGVDSAETELAREEVTYENSQESAPSSEPSGEAQNTSTSHNIASKQSSETEARSVTNNNNTESEENETQEIDGEAANNSTDQEATQDNSQGKGSLMGSSSAGTSAGKELNNSSASEGNKAQSNSTAPAAESAEENEGGDANSDNSGREHTGSRANNSSKLSGENSTSKNQLDSEASSFAKKLGSDMRKASAATRSDQSSRINSYNSINQIKVEVQKNIDNLKQGSSINIKLSPESLGDIDVKMELLDKNTLHSMKIMAEKPSTMEMLQKDSMTLEQNLKEVLETENTELSFDLKHGSDGEEQRRQYEGAQEKLESLQKYNENSRDTQNYELNYAAGHINRPTHGGVLSIEV